MAAASATKTAPFAGGKGSEKQRGSARPRGMLTELKYQKLCGVRAKSAR